MSGRNYAYWQAALAKERLPVAVVDLDAFDRNVTHLAEIARKNGKKIRIATKSIRVPELIKRVLAAGEPYAGLMCYSAEEAAFLAANQLDDLMVAYPTVQATDLKLLRDLNDRGVRVSLVIDSIEQLERVAAAMTGTLQPFRLVIEMDMSLRLLGGLVHLGVRRSPVRTASDLTTLLEAARKKSMLRVVGVMAYEAQVAGLGDRNPFKKFLNPVFALVRKLSIGSVAKARAKVPEVFKKAGIPLEIFNGGGTGSANLSAKEASLTEITAGSGLVSSHLFDYYSNIRFEPAAFFALQTVRSSDPGYVTCLGGGYIASGEPGWDKVPTPHLPPSLSLLGGEACGEVQTPLQVKGGITPELGGPVLFRHAKAGELAERFNDYLLLSDGKPPARAKTYRGLGLCFF